MCCHLGVWLSDENAALIERLARDEVEFFHELDLDLPDQVVVDGEWRGEPTGKKTAVRQTTFAKDVPDYPAHFSDTACVFHLGDGRCALQLLSVARGKHPWYYKPIACWLHPITVTREADGAEGIRIVLFDETTDEFRTPGYHGFTTFTFCGKTCAGGRPAFEVLAEELEFLGHIAGRDLIGEIKAVEKDR